MPERNSVHGAGDLSPAPCFSLVCSSADDAFAPESGVKGQCEKKLSVPLVKSGDVFI